MRRSLLKTKKRGDTGYGAASLSVLVLCAQDACKVGLASGRDEELWPDLTSRVDTLSQDEDSSVDCVLHGDDLALPVAEREVVVEEPLAELVGPHGGDGLRQDLAEGAGGEVSVCGFDGFTEGWASTSASALARAARSSLRFMRSLIPMSGSASMVAYMPCLRMEGRTSLVTQRRKALASGLSDRMMTS